MTKDEAEDIKRHFDVVADQLDSSIHAVAEGVAANTERIERLESETRAGFARVDSQFARVDSQFTGVDSRFDRLEREMGRGFHELGERVERLESKQTT